MTKVKIMKSKNEIRGELFQVKCARVEAVIYDAETKDLSFNILNADKVIEMMAVDPINRRYTRYSYDNNGRVDSVWNWITDSTKLGYGINSFASLKDTILPLPQKADFSYSYNIRGEVTSINYNKLNLTQYNLYTAKGYLKNTFVQNDTGAIVYQDLIIRNLDGVFHRNTFETAKLQL